MQVSFAPAFLKQIEKLDPQWKLAAKETAVKVVDFYDFGIRTPGLGIKRLRGDIWEARSGVRLRILYRLSGDSLRFVLAGTPDEVKRFLAAH